MPRNEKNTPQQKLLGLEPKAPNRGRIATPISHPCSRVGYSTSLKKKFFIYI